jgi:hypothetical protein
MAQRIAPRPPKAADSDKLDGVDGSGYATAAYVDSVAAGLDPKGSVRAATTANISLSGLQTVDGVALVAGDRVLVKDQTTPSQNGIYVVAAGAWARASDFDGSPASEVTSGAYCYVTEGTVNGGTAFILSTPDPIVLGTTGLSFTAFTGPLQNVGRIRQVAGSPAGVSNGDVWLDTTTNELKFRTSGTSRAAQGTEAKDVASGYVGLTSGRQITPGSTNLSTATRTAGSTFNANNATVNPCDASAAAFATTLPLANAQQGKFFIFVKTDSSANAVTLQRQGSDTIAGATSIVLSQQYQFVLLAADGTSTWNILAQGLASTNGAVRVPTLSADPSSPAAGEVWMESSGGLFKFRSPGGVTRSIEHGGNKDAASGYVGLNASKQINPASFNIGTAAATSGATLTASSNTMQRGDASAGAFGFTLPLASAQVGKVFIFTKTDASGNTVSVNTAGSDTIAGVASLALVGMNQYLALVSDGVSAWNPVSLGVGASFGVPVFTRSGTTSLGHHATTVNRCDASTGAITITLPSAAGAPGKLFIFKKVDATANAVTIQRSGADTIDDATSLVLNTKHQSVTLVADGAGMWMVV